MYQAALVAHSFLRWLVILLGLLAIGRAIAGLAVRTDWTRADDRIGLFFTISVDLQILVGLLLYFLLSPITTTALHHLGAAMSNDVARFWAVEHPTLMIAALVLVHVGRLRAKLAAAAPARHRAAVVFYVLALAAILIATPWPLFAYGRPLVRLAY
jgi:hypothetical protein